MNALQLYVLFVGGIILSLLVPIAAKWLREARSGLGTRGDALSALWAVAQPYVKIAAGSAILGLALVLIFLASGAKTQDISWFNAVLYGYGWDSTLQKLNQPSPA